MRIEVKTCNNVRILLDQSKAKSQRKIIKGDSHHYQVTLLDGSVMDLISSVPDVPELPEIDITQKTKFINRLDQKISKNSR